LFVAEDYFRNRHNSAQEASYRLYGLTITSEFPFRYHLEPSSGAPDLRFVYHGVTEEADPPGEEIAGSFLGGDSVGTSMRLFRDKARETIVFPGIAAFECSAEEIHARAFVADIEYLIEICLMGYVMSYWLERRGMCAIHASAVCIHDQAVAFIAGTSRGKTTMACSMLAAGYPLLTDDILPIRISPGTFRVFPGFPQMKLLPEQLAILGDTPGEFEKVHPLFDKLKVPIGSEIGTYYDRPLSQAVIYQLDRDGDNSQVKPQALPMSRRAALLELLRHSFAAELVDAADRGALRLERLASVAGRVTVKRLILPDGYRRLEEVRDFVVRDVERSA
jgi:hypothetical protein